MTFDLASAPVVFLAWERGLGLPADSLLVGAKKGRITHAADSPQLTFIRLWDQSILVGPQHLLSAAEAYDDDELSDHSTMLRLTRYDGGRGLGTQGLYYADELAPFQPVHTVHVATGSEPVAVLESLCPPDDVNDVRLSLREHQFTVMDSGASDAGPIACSAYAEYQGLLAQIGTLVAPEQRRRGAGRLATSIAAQEALGAGLIVQWRADINNSAAHALATSVGFSVVGLQTQVDLQTR